MRNTSQTGLRALAGRLAAATVIIGTLCSTASAGLIYRIDIDSNYGGAPTTTEGGWTSLNVGGSFADGRNVTVDDVNFSVFGSDGSRSRTADSSDLTRDFVYDDGAGQDVGLRISGLLDGLWEASVYSFDASYAPGPQIVGITQFGPPEDIYTSSYAASASAPFVFQFDSSSLLDGFGIFTRAATSVNRSRFNALELRQLAPASQVQAFAQLQRATVQGVPGPAAFWLLPLGALCMGFARQRGKGTA